MEGFKELFQTSSIHGVGHILSEEKLFKVLWIFVVFSGFIGAGLIISQSFLSWEESPVSTTIETQSISQLDFPEVVVCPAKHSFTTLGPDLELTENQTIEEDTKSGMLEILTDAVFDINFEKKYQELEQFYEKDRFRNWYEGYSKIVFPNKNKYHLAKTSAVSGTFSTPFFGETFKEKDFILGFTSQISIYVPQRFRSNSSISIVIDIEYDIEENILSRIAEYIKVFGSNTGFSDYEELDAKQKTYHKEFPLLGDRYYNIED